MKLLISFATISLLTANFAFAQSDKTPYGYTNYISQKLLTNNVEMAPGIKVNSSGVSQSIGVAFSSIGGSRYDLYTIRAQTPQSPLMSIPLASTTIGLFKTDTKLVVNSDDPFNSYIGATGPRRTMAGKQFSVTATVTGLETDLTKPRCFRFINLYRNMQSYLPTKTEEGRWNNPLLALPSIELAKNGITNLPYTSSLSDPTLLEYNNQGACGEETFEAWTLDDNQLAGQMIPGRRLDNNKIQVWPCPSAKIQINWETTSRIVRTVVPSMTFTFKDVYPSSNIYVKVYPGLPNMATKGVRVGELNYPNTKNVCFTPPPNISPNNFNTYFPTDGLWTVEVVASWPGITAWADQSLTAETIPIDRTFRINTNLTTSE
jgi:hypothetical protein